jgi:hypothetical protein
MTLSQRVKRELFSCILILYHWIDKSEKRFYEALIERVLISCISYKRIYPYMKSQINNNFFLGLLVWKEYSIQRPSGKSIIYTPSNSFR